MMPSRDKRIDALEQATKLRETENSSRISRMESEKRLDEAFAIALAQHWSRPPSNKTPEEVTREFKEKLMRWTAEDEHRRGQSCGFIGG